MSSSGLFTLFYHILLMCVSLSSATITCENYNGLEGVQKCTLGNDSGGILDEFPPHAKAATTLYVSNQRAIHDISSTAFDSFTNLGSLYLNDNSLRRVSPEWFKKLENIGEIDLSGNFITHVNDKAFLQCKRILTINLSRNLIEDFRYPSKDLNSAYVDLSKNPLQRIEIGPVSSLYLDETNLTELHLPNNVRKLYARNSKISSFSASSNLEILHLDRNNLSNIMNITVLSNLIYLSLSGNNIGAPSPDSFLNLHRLQYLYLSKTNIPYLYYGLIANLSDLKVLDLSENKISHFNTNHLRMIQDNGLLVDLYMHNNPINKITDDGLLFRYLPRFVFGGNSVDLDCQRIMDLYNTYRNIQVPDDLKRFDIDNVGGIGCHDPNKS